MTLLLLMNHCSSCPEIQGGGNIRDLDLSNYKCNYYLSNFIFTAITRLLIKHGPFHVFTLFGAFVTGMSSSVGPPRGARWQIDKVVLTGNCCEKWDGSCCVAIEEAVVGRVFQEEKLLSCSHMEESVLLGNPGVLGNVGAVLLQPALPQGCVLVMKGSKTHHRASMLL